MVEFCALFDSGYLARAVVLARTLAEVCPGATLRAFCLDDLAFSLLDRLELPGVTPISRTELETADPELASVRSERTISEYSWTATPCVCLHTLAREPLLQAITYVDADLMFFADPSPIFDELGRDSILLTPHRFASARVPNESRAGIFNVQFMTFRRDEHGLAALSWWRDRCLERCEIAPAAGFHGDQKYLDDWPERFGGVHVLEHPGALAPWNLASHRLERKNGRVLVDGTPLLFFHYAALGLYRGLASARRLGLFGGQLQLAREPAPLVWGAPAPFAPGELELLWQPYLRKLGEALADIRALDPGFRAGIRPLGPLEAIKLARLRRRRGRTVRAGSH